METKNIYLVSSLVSSGKSSFLNALANGLVSCVSLQTETLDLIKFSMTKNGTYENLLKIKDKLKELHENNENNRKNIKNCGLSYDYSNIESKDSRTDNKLSENLPIHNYYNINDFNIYDAPAIDDSFDKNEIFFSLLKNNISKMDIIFYVTDANCALVSKSEIELIKKIQKMIEYEKENLHHIDLAIIVNKYDDIEDNDLKDIYDRIGDKIKNIKTFRVSSHKLLINNLIKNKLNFIFPEFMNKEVKKILKNANINITEEINLMMQYNFIKNSSLNPYCKVLNLPNNCDIEGDWDNVISFIGECQDDSRLNKNKIIKDKINDFFDDVIELYSNTKIIAKIIGSSKSIKKKESDSESDSDSEDESKSIKKKKDSESDSDSEDELRSIKKKKYLDSDSENELKSIKKKKYSESDSDSENELKSIKKKKDSESDSDSYSEDESKKIHLFYDDFFKKEINLSKKIIVCADKIKKYDIEGDILDIIDCILIRIDDLFSNITKKTRCLTLEILVQLNIAWILNNEIFTKVMKNNNISFETKVEIFLLGMNDENDVHYLRLLSKILCDSKAYVKQSYNYYCLNNNTTKIRNIIFSNHLIKSDNIPKNIKKMITIALLEKDKLKILLNMNLINFNDIIYRYDDDMSQINNKILTYSIYEWINNIKTKNTLCEKLFDNSLINNSKKNLDDNVIDYFLKE